MSNQVNAQYQPACRPAKSGSCSNCSLAYDCQRKISGGSLLPLVVAALAVSSLFALIAG